MSNIFEFMSMCLFTVVMVGLTIVLIACIIWVIDITVCDTGFLSIKFNEYCR